MTVKHLRWYCTVSSRRNIKVFTQGAHSSLTHSSDNDVESPDTNIMDAKLNEASERLAYVEWLLKIVLVFSAFSVFTVVGGFLLFAFYGN